MTNKIKLTAAKKNKIAAAYQGGATGAELAAKFNVSVSKIFNALRDLGVTIRPRGRQPQAV
jgi:Mor family transcriptional regulator